MVKVYFQKFKTNINGILIPEEFTYPFFYKPHLLSRIAVHELQNYLKNQNDFKHNFGLHNSDLTLAIGKMFGVLVCKNKNNELGYIAAFSGKLANENNISFFVPTVFDMLQPNSFFLNEEEKINAINIEIEILENNTEYIYAKNNLENIISESEQDILRFKNEIKKNKKSRDILRKEKLNEIDTVFLEKLKFESQQEGILLKKMMAFWNYKTLDARNEVLPFEDKLFALKNDRKEKSKTLQNKLFESYSFLNQKLELKSLAELFNYNPPAGAGECAAPKLLHFAFQHNLKPICMAEFWWGVSPKSEIRKHKQFYPSCTSKCKPILMGHMLKDIVLEPNLLLKNNAINKEIEIIYEDESLLIINKPTELLSVPGKNIKDSVYSRIRNKFPNLSGPIIVHRLDMSTSGIMLLAKNEISYYQLQQQFIKRKVEKCYEAILDGTITAKIGEINLPLRLDITDRPRQLVCFANGKKAYTKFEVIAEKNNKTLIHFFPITGRTHQLRVHASHPLGLNAPIIGDDLYGKESDRLYLHAKKSHSFTLKRMKK